MWKKQIEKTQELKTPSDVVIILEEDGMLVASVNNNHTEGEFIAILGVDSNREGMRISELYNRMIERGVKVTSLNSIAEAISILGEK